MIVAAVAAGALAGLKDTASTAVKDAYGKLKRLLSERHVDVGAVERKPDSDIKRQSLAEDLADAAAGADDALLAAAQATIEAVKRHDPAAATALGIDIERVYAEFLRISRIKVTGGAVTLRDLHTAGGIVIEDASVDVPGAAAPDRPPAG